MNRFLAYAEGKKALSTIQSYYRMTNTLVAWLERHDKNVLTATAETLDQFANRPLVRPKGDAAIGDPPSDATRKKAVMELRAFYHWLCDIAQERADNPARLLFAPEPENEDPHPIDSGQWAKVWGSDLSDSDRVAFGMAFFCGFRRAEVCWLDACNLALDPLRTVMFQRKGRRHPVRQYPVHKTVGLFALKRPDLLPDVRVFNSAVKRLLKARADSPLLLDWRDSLDRRMRPEFEGVVPEDVMPPNTFNDRLFLAQENAGIPSEDWATPHMLRHGFVTYLLHMGPVNNGRWLMEVSRLAAHKDVRTTQRYIATSGDDETLDKVLADLTDGLDDAEGGATVKPLNWWAKG